MDKKTSLRIKAKEIRKSLNIKQIGNILADKIVELEQFKQAQNIMIYYPLDNEIDILKLLDSEDKNFFLPRMNGKNLECCPFKKGDILKKAKYNIQEPITECVICPQLDLIIVPALAVDISGNRLGYGGGFYDRFLANNKALTLTPIPKELIFDNIPSEKFDIKIDLIISDK